MRVTLRPYQLEALDKVAAARARGVTRQMGVAATGLGKALPVDELVLTPHGWSTMGALRVGDYVIGGDGRPTPVVGVFPQGVRPVLEVEFSDGAAVRCDADHLWAVRDKYGRRGRPWRLMTTSDLAGSDQRWRVPLVRVEHGPVSLPLDPYLLGVLLGDGGLSTPGRVLLHTEHALAQSLALPAPCTLTKMHDDGPARMAGTYIIGGPVGRGRNPVLWAIRSLGLEGAHADTKRVPWLYTVAAADDRLALLRGIMDADGYVSAGGHVEITLANEALAGDVVDLVRSLGGTARLRHKATSWLYRGEHRDGDAWRVSVAMAECPFRWKADRWRPRTKYPPLRQIEAVRPVAAAECVCIKVAAPDGLFVVRDYVVTHNTIIFCALAERTGGRTLILAHRDELITQAADKVTQVWPDAHVGIVKAEQNNVAAQVVVASVQTLARERRRTDLVVEHWTRQPFDLVVVDEAHHSAADTYRLILAELGCLAPGGPLLLGVTATPQRGDNIRLDDLYQEITFDYPMLWGIEAGYLCDMRGLRITTEMDLASVRTSRGDYEAGSAGEAMEAADVPRMIAEAFVEHAPGRRALAFLPTVETARQTSDELRTLGVRAELVHGGTPIEERRQILRDYELGLVEVVSNCMVLTEGFDDPRTDCIIVGRPTKSQSLYVQMVGRGSRRHPDKTDCLVLDVVGVTAAHSLVTLPSLFGVDADEVEASGLTMTEAVAKQMEMRIAAGQLAAREVELFRRITEAPINWVQARPEPRSYVLGITTADQAKETVVIKDLGPSGWGAKTVRKGVGQRLLVRDVPLELAQGIAEDYVRKMSAVEVIHRRDSRWRQRPPSEAALGAARKWRMKIDERWTAGELSDALNAHIARRTGVV